jgi:hypothetical protein
VSALDEMDTMFSMAEIEDVEGADKVGKEFDWSGEEITAHYSSLSLHRKCPEAWYFRYGLELGRPLMGPAPELHFGSWFGTLRTAEALARGRRRDSLIAPPKRYQPIERGKGQPWFDQATMTPQDVVDAAKDWWRLQSSDTCAAWDERLGEDLPRRLVSTYSRWRDEYGDKLKLERPLAVELFWKRSLPRPRSDASWESVDLDKMPVLWLLGFIDEVYFDEEKGMVVIRDNKTSKNLSSQSSADDMMDSQLSLYGWGSAPLLQELGALGPARAMSFDRVRSVKPSTPKLNLNGSLSASVTVFDKKTYLEWATENTVPEDLPAAYETETKKKWEDLDDERKLQVLELANTPGRIFGKIGTFTASGEPKFGIYQPDPAVLERITTPSHRATFFQRTLTPISRYMIESHIRSAIDSATDIWRTMKRAETELGGARNLSTNNCRWCDYNGLCRARMFGGNDGTYDLREFNLRSRKGHILANGRVGEN